METCILLAGVRVHEHLWPQGGSGALKKWDNLSKLCGPLILWKIVSSLKVGPKIDWELIKNNFKRWQSVDETKSSDNVVVVVAHTVVVIVVVAFVVVAAAAAASPPNFFDKNQISFCSKHETGGDDWTYLKGKRTKYEWKIFNEKCSRSTDLYWHLKGESPGLVSWSRGRGFESQWRILDGIEIFHIDLL